MEQADNNTVAAFRSYPGEILDEYYLKNERFTLESLSEKSGISIKDLKDIVAGEMQISLETSTKLSDALGLETKELWHTLQERCDAENSGTLKAYDREQALKKLKRKKDALLAFISVGIDNSLKKYGFGIVRLMKLINFIDREFCNVHGKKLENGYFHVKNSKQGAVDENIYSIVKELENDGFLKQYQNGNIEINKLGIEKGKQIIEKINHDFQEYFEKTSNWIMENNNSEKAMWTSYVMYPDTMTHESKYHNKSLPFATECALVTDRILTRRIDLYRELDEDLYETRNSIKIEVFDKPMNSGLKLLSASVITDAYSNISDETHNISDIIDKCNEALKDETDILTIAATYFKFIMEIDPVMALLACEISLCLNGHGEILVTDNGTMELLVDMFEDGDDSIDDVAGFIEGELNL